MDSPCNHQDLPKTVNNFPRTNQKHQKPAQNIQTGSITALMQKPPEAPFIWPGLPRTTKRTTWNLRTTFKTDPEPRRTYPQSVRTIKNHPKTNKSFLRTIINQQQLSRTKWTLPGIIEIYPDHQESPQNTSEPAQNLLRTILTHPELHRTTYMLLRTSLTAIKTYLRPPGKSQNLQRNTETLPKTIQNQNYH